MEDMILEEVRRDVLERPKSSLDLIYLFSLKKQLQELANEKNAELKKNVYKNYSLFIDSSREISTLKNEMKQLNNLLDQQQTNMNKLLEQLNKTPIIQPTLERPKIDPFRLELNEDASEVEAEMLPSWFTKSPEDFDVLIAQRNFKEAVRLALRVKDHFEQYPKCCSTKPIISQTHENQDLKSKIDIRLRELKIAICSELQPATDRTIQGGPRSSVTPIKLLRELNLASKAVKLYLDQRSSILRFVLSQHQSEPTLQSIKQICSIFYHNTTDTCEEFKEAFELNEHVNKAVEESLERLDIEINLQEDLLCDLVNPIYLSPHPPLSNDSPTNDNDISSHILSQSSILPMRTSKSAFSNLSFYASLTYWIMEEFEYFTKIFCGCVFKRQLTISVVAECVHHFRNQCSEMVSDCQIDMSKFIETKLESEIDGVLEESKEKLFNNIQKLESEETWQGQQFQNKAQLTRFYEEMNDVGIETMHRYITDDRKLPFTSSKTSFARYYLITVNDLAKLVSPRNKDQIERILAEAIERVIKSILEAASREKAQSKVRLIMSNGNFLLQKVILEAAKQYTKISGCKCKKLVDLVEKYGETFKLKGNVK